MSNKTRMNGCCFQEKMRRIRRKSHIAKRK